MSFYHLIRLINFIRLKTSTQTCFKCNESQADLSCHFEKSKCTENPTFPPIDGEGFIWNDPKFLFPTFEDDPLLFDAGDSDGEDEDEDGIEKDTLLSIDNERFQKLVSIREEISKSG